MIKCGLCGKEFEDGQFDEYSAHVQKCAAEMSMKKKTEDMKKIQAELEEVKRAKVVYEGLRDAFKEKYPDIYRVNFQEDVVEKSDNKDTIHKNSNNSKMNIDNTNNDNNVPNKNTTGKRRSSYFIKDEDTIEDFLRELFGLNL